MEFDGLECSYDYSQNDLIWDFDRTSAELFEEGADDEIWAWHDAHTVKIEPEAWE